MRTRARYAAMASLVAIAALCAALAAHAQPGAKVPRIVVIGVTPTNPTLAESFKQGLGELGYVEGRNVLIDHRDAGGSPERFPTLAPELVQPNIDLIFARGAGALATAKQATERTPIVAVDLESDPVARGFVRTLGQPGGNITGVFLDLPELSGKQLQLLKEIIRSVPRVAIIGDPTLNAPQFRATESAAHTLAIQPRLLEVAAMGEFPRAIETARKGRASALLLLSSPLVFNRRAEIAALALERRLPAISMFVEFAEAGGLMAYGPSLREAFLRAGVYAGRILQGTKPGGLPVERPTKFEWVINQKTARTLGLSIPPSVLARAYRIVEVMRRLALAVLAISLGATADVAADDRSAAWAALAQGGHVAVIRHGNAPPGRGGDPPGFKLEDCATQRNLARSC
jgi:putative tryptophan/tyrosine transport system substrate-binding protein